MDWSFLKTRSDVYLQSSLVSKVHTTNPKREGWRDAETLLHSQKFKINISTQTGELLCTQTPRITTSQPWGVKEVELLIWIQEDSDMTCPIQAEAQIPQN